MAANGDELRWFCVFSKLNGWGGWGQREGKEAAPLQGGGRTLPVSQFTVETWRQNEQIVDTNSGCSTSQGARLVFPSFDSSGSRRSGCSDVSLTLTFHVVLRRQSSNRRIWFRGRDLLTIGPWCYCRNSVVMTNPAHSADKAPSFEMTWGSSTSSGYCSDDGSESEFEQFFTARTSFFTQSRKANVSPKKVTLEGGVKV